MLVTHQNRGQIKRDSFAAGIPIEEIKHFLGYLHEAQTNSYIDNLSNDCLIDRAGSKPIDKKIHDPAWGSVTAAPVIESVFPYINYELNKVNCMINSNMTKEQKG